MEVSGTIKVIGNKEQISDKFSKRDLVLTIDEGSQYPQHILIQFTNAKCDELNQSHVGQKVTVSINLQGRLWTNPQGEDKYFNTLNGWKISAESQAPSFQAQPEQPPYPAPSNEDHEDIPF